MRQNTRTCIAHRLQGNGRYEAFTYLAIRLATATARYRPRRRRSVATGCGNAAVSIAVVVFARQDILHNMQRVGGAASLLREHRHLLSPEIVHYLLSPEIVHYAERELAQTAADIGAAENTRGAIYHRMLAFFADYDILATPTVIAPPYDIRQRHLMEVAGTKFDDFFAYLMLTSVITATTSRRSRCLVASQLRDYQLGYN